MRRLDAAIVAVFSIALTGCQNDDGTTPALSATCAAQPSSGSAPLSVRFLLSVSGAEGPFTVAVSYGDGASGSDPDVPHTYAVSGTYTASFAVDSETQSARCAVVVSVGGPSPSPSPTPGSNQPPQPVFKTSPPARNGTVTGVAPLSVGLNMCLTSDPEQDWLFFSIDYTGDGTWDNRGPFGGNCRKEYVYPAGSYSPRLCVHDIDSARRPLHDDQCHTFTVVATP